MRIRFIQRCVFLMANDILKLLQSKNYQILLGSHINLWFPRTFRCIVLIEFEAWDKNALTLIRFKPGIIGYIIRYVLSNQIAHNNKSLFCLLLLFFVFSISDATLGSRILHAKTHNEITNECWLHYMAGMLSTCGKHFVSFHCIKMAVKRIYYIGVFCLDSSKIVPKRKHRVLFRLL